MKRLFDIIFSFLGLVILSPVLIVTLAATYFEDFHSPFYIANRVGRGNKGFKMIKIRSMVVNADKSGVDSTSSNDPRITKIGGFIRKFKLDEFSQLINVFMGSMSLVGPRPNVRREVDLYTDEEMELISVRPGITDVSSIVFSDENDILADSKDPDLDYNQLIRPWKSRLGILYIRNRTFLMDFRLILITVIAILNRPRALSLIEGILVKSNADENLIEISKREKDLYPFPPPGSSVIVTSR